MSGLAVKSKVTRNFWNPQKDLQSTVHSSKIGSRLSTVDGQSGVAISSHASTISNHYNQKQTKQKYSSADQLKQAHWFQKSQIQYENSHDDIQNGNLKYDQFNNQNCKSETMRTPLSKSQYNQHANFQKKYVDNLHDANTTQTKYMINSTPRQVLQQSQIVFKGSRDVKKIAPMKLIYEDHQCIQQNKSTKDNQTIQINIFNPPTNQNLPVPTSQINLKLLKKSNHQTSLILLQKSMTIFSLIKLRNSFCLDYFIDQGILPVYNKRKIGTKTYLFCQPYQYTLDQLFRYNKIEEQKIKIICKHLQGPLKSLCNEKYSFFEVEGIEKCIFYTHGKFKILPIFAKGKVLSCKNFNKLRDQVQEYLLGYLRVAGI